MPRFTLEMTKPGEEWVEVGWFDKLETAINRAEDMLTEDRKWLDEYETIYRIIDDKDGSVVETFE